MSSTDQPEQEPQAVQPVQVLYCDSTTSPFLPTVHLDLPFSAQFARFLQSIVNLGRV